MQSLKDVINQNQNRKHGKFTSLGFTNYETSTFYINVDDITVLDKFEKLPTTKEIEYLNNIMKEYSSSRLNNNNVMLYLILTNYYDFSSESASLMCSISSHLKVSMAMTLLNYIILRPSDYEWKQLFVELINIKRMDTVNSNTTNFNHKTSLDIFISILRNETSICDTIIPILDRNLGELAGTYSIEEHKYFMELLKLFKDDEIDTVLNRWFHVNKATYIYYTKLGLSEEEFHAVIQAEVYSELETLCKELKYGESTWLYDNMGVLRLGRCTLPDFDDEELEIKLYKVACTVKQFNY